MKKLSRDKRAFRRWISRQMDAILSDEDWIKEQIEISKEGKSKQNIIGLSETYFKKP